jgi:Ca-activated chloride channel homolog
VKNGRNPRKALRIISDGGENHSRYSAKDIHGLVREADVQIYAMGVFEPSLSLGMSKEKKSGPRLLVEIAEQTGGRAFFPLRRAATCRAWPRALESNW